LTAARNLGAQLAKGDLIAYCDDDAQLDPDGLAGLNQAFAAEPKLMAAGGVIKNYDPPSALAQLFTRLFYRGPFFDERQPIYWNWRHLDPDKLLPTSKLNGGMMAFRRDILDRVGGFDDRLRAACVAEDIDIAQRILLHCGEPNAVKLVPSVRIVHESLGSWRKEDRSIEFQIVSQHYLLHRNLGYAATHHFQYWWMVFGLLLRAAIASIRRRRLQPLRSFAKGIKCIQHDYRNCPFIGPASTASR
jgi:GT2 family glycosyltransferase